MSSIPGSVLGIVVGAVVGMVVGAVVGAVVGRVVGSTVVGGTVVGWVISFFLRLQPVREKTVRTSARAIHKYFFILKPPNLIDFRGSISRCVVFSLVIFDADQEKLGKF